MELRLLVSTAKDIVVANAKAIYIVVSNAINQSINQIKIVLYL